MSDYQANQRNTVTLLLQIQERDSDEWSTVSTATSHVEQSTALYETLVRTRDDWQDSGIFHANARWRIVTT